MAKKRKRPNKKRGSGKRPSPKLIAEVGAAMEAFEEGEAAVAMRRLTELAARFPRSKTILLAIVEVSQDIGDWRSYALFGEQLYPLEHGEDQAETLNNMVYAFQALFYPALVWHYAQLLLEKHPSFTLIGQARQAAEALQPILLQQAEDVLDTEGATESEILEAMVQHDLLRFYTESMRPKQAIPLAEALLERWPNFPSVFNNLSLNYFLTGDIDRAIATSQEVLAQQPENFHALGNIVRFTFLTAQFDEAKQYVDRLLAVEDENSDLIAKQIEALAFLGEDGEIIKLFEAAQPESLQTNIQIYHLTAVAYFRTGQEIKAWQLWQQAVNLAPNLTMAQDSLNERHLPKGEQTVPWYWPLSYWIDTQLLEEMKRGFSKGRASDRVIKRTMASILEKRPYLPHLFPHMLEKGDTHAREFVLNWVRTFDEPKWAEMVYAFAKEKYGSDAIRIDAAQLITEKYQHLLPANRMMPMWINGEQTELLMIGFEISDEPETPTRTTKEILDKHEQGHILIHEEKLADAEATYLDIIETDPTFYPAYNQLAAIYELQGRTEEAQAQIKETFDRFPDYLFARVGVARLLIRDKEIEKARDLLLPLMRLQKLHFSEFFALASAFIEIAIAEKKPKAAQMWLDTWEQIDPDDPRLMDFQLRVAGPGNLLKNLRDLLGQ